MTAQGKRRVVIDTDPGVDDAMAIIHALRAPELDVVAITTVFGNTDPQTGARNALRLLELSDHPLIPVGIGCAQALMYPQIDSPVQIHGADGFGDVSEPEPDASPVQAPGPQLLIEQILGHDGPTTLLTLGPLSNVAVALRTRPEIVERIDELIVMGGSTLRGNVTPVAEANFFNDPHAAAIVLGAGCPVTVVGLNVTHRAVLESAWLEQRKDLSKRADFVWRSSRHYQKFFDETGINSRPGVIHPHDLVAAAYLTDPDVFDVDSVRANVVTEGTARGQLITGDYLVPIVDDDERSTIKVCTDLDNDRFLKLFEASLGNSRDSRLTQ